MKNIVLKKKLFPSRSDYFFMNVSIPYIKLFNILQATTNITLRLKNDERFSIFDNELINNRKKALLVTRTVFLNETGTVH